MKERGNPWLRRADRGLGIPLVLLFGGWMRLKRLIRGDHESGLVANSRDAPLVVTLLKSAAIGDTVMLSAVVRDIRDQRPRMRLRIACGTSNASLARMIVGVDEVIALPMSSPMGLWRMRERLRSDIFIDFDSWPRINALISRMSGSLMTIGFRTAGQHRHHVYAQVVDHSFDIHEVENYRNLARAFDIRIAPPDGPPARPWLGRPDPNRALSQAHPFVVFHMFSGGSQSRMKEWTPENWKVVAQACLASGYDVRLSGGPADLERNEEFVARFSAKDRIETLPVVALDRQLALLESSAAVISVDTGIAHLAAASGAPTVVLHGPTSPQRWGALGPRVTFIKDKQSPWINLGFERSETGRPLQLTPEEVVSQLLAILADRCGSCAAEIAAGLIRTKN